MFELSGVNYEEVLEQGDSNLVRVIASSSYRGFELSGLYCIKPFVSIACLRLTMHYSLFLLIIVFSFKKISLLI